MTTSHQAVGSPRPAAPDFGDGGRYEAVAESEASWGLEWEVIEPERSRPCRWGKGACRQPSVAILHRGRFGQQPWHYCGEHLYGRWIENGQMMSWWRVREE